MSLGHGQPGLVDNLRTFSDLVDDSAASRRPYLEFFPGANLPREMWILNSGAAYAFNGLLQYALSGVPLDVVGVDTDLGPLTRVESLADCIATAGTFYAVINIGDTTAAPLWDDGVTLWDAAGVTWDHVTSVDLYVHLAGDGNPNVVAVVPLLGLFIGTRGEVHPQLGPDKLVNGGYENGLTGWTESLSGAGFSTAQDLVLFTGRGSVASLKLVSTGAATGNATRFQDQPTVTGERYRLSGYYETDVAFSANLAARLLVGNTAGTSILYRDGRDADASGQAVLTPTGGEWRRFFFDFLAVATTTRVQAQLRAASSAGAGQANFDGVKLQRIYRFNYYEPRLSAESLPDVEVASQSIFFAGKTFGLGNAKILNVDGILESMFGQLLVHNRQAKLYVGGVLMDGQEVYRDDWRGGWPGLTQRVEVTDAFIDLTLDDERSRVAQDLPPRSYSKTDFPNLLANWSNFPRPICFGFSFVEPKRIDLTADGYGIYELVDPSFGPVASTGAPADGVFIYGSADFAQKELFQFRLTSGTHYQLEENNSRIRILDDVHHYRFDRSGNQIGDNSAFDFDIGGATLTAAFNMTGPASTVAAALQAAMRAIASVADINVAYSNTTKKWTISKDAGTLALRGSTGPNSANDYWQYLGFIHSDHTGALSYTGENATFSSADTDHIIRAQAYGYTDDAAGTITGTPNGLVKKQAHVAYFLLNKILGVTATRLDKPSFDQAATLETGTGTASLDHAWLYLTETTPMQELLARIETGLLADLVIDGDGVWSLRAYQLNMSIRAAFFDRDYLTFGVIHSVDSVYRKTRVLHAYSPNRGTWEQTESADDPSVATKYGRDKVREVKTMLASSSHDPSQPPAQLAIRLQRLSAAVPRIVEFSSRGKLADILVGDKIQITRARAYGASGSLAAVGFRVLSLRHSFLRGVSTCLAIEDITFLN